MGTYIVKRVIHSLPLLVMVIIFSFFVIHIMPGDPVRTLISVVMGIPLGILSVRHHGKMAEHLLALPALVSISIPIFWTAILMLQLFTVNLNSTGF